MIYLEFFLKLLMLIVVAGTGSPKLYSRATAGATLSSQNAAALLIDLGTSIFAAWGLKSQRILEVGCSE
ncbi:hypothetical protein [Bradyrhizobium genosp. A]|uniref:hypothetical protein n=1 Tax=Bradyrhizobium genosp. A TaxID=83626 RepID=UPI003CF2C14D